MPRTDLSQLRMIAQSKYDQHGPDMGRYARILEAIRQVEDFDAETGDSIACTRCSMTFPNAGDKSAHFWATH